MNVLITLLSYCSYSSTGPSAPTKEALQLDHAPVALEFVVPVSTEAVFLVVLETSWERERNEFLNDSPLYLVPCSLPARFQHD
jgi:hypothetical protein